MNIWNAQVSVKETLMAQWNNREKGQSKLQTVTEWYTNGKIQSKVVGVKDTVEVLE